MRTYGIIHLVRDTLKRVPRKHCAYAQRNSRRTLQGVAPALGGGADALAVNVTEGSPATVACTT